MIGVLEGDPCVIDNDTGIVRHMALLTEDEHDSIARAEKTAQVAKECYEAFESWQGELGENIAYLLHAAATGQTFELEMSNSRHARFRAVLEEWTTKSIYPLTTVWSIVDIRELDEAVDAPTPTDLEKVWAWMSANPVQQGRVKALIARVSQHCPKPSYVRTYVDMTFAEDSAREFGIPEFNVMALAGDLREKVIAHIKDQMGYGTPETT